MKPDSTVKFYAGFLSFEILVKTFNALQPTAENVYTWSQMQRLRGKGSNDTDKLRKSLKQCKLSLFDQFHLILQNLRVGTFNQVLADTFNISLPTVSLPPAWFSTVRCIHLIRVTPLIRGMW